jgi:hypothetical protein
LKGVNEQLTADGDPWILKNLLRRLYSLPVNVPQTITIEKILLERFTNHHLDGVLYSFFPGKEICSCKSLNNFDEETVFCEYCNVLYHLRCIPSKYRGPRNALLKCHRCTESEPKNSKPHQHSVMLNDWDSKSKNIPSNDIDYENDSIMKSEVKYDTKSNSQSYSQSVDLPLASENQSAVSTFYKNFKSPASSKNDNENLNRKRRLGTLERHSNKHNTADLSEYKKTSEDLEIYEHDPSLYHTQVAQHHRNYAKVGRPVPEGFERHPKPTAKHRNTNIYAGNRLPSMKDPNWDENLDGEKSYQHGHIDSNWKFNEQEQYPPNTDYSEVHGKDFPHFSEPHPYNYHEDLKKFTPQQYDEYYRYYHGNYYPDYNYGAYGIPQYEVPRFHLDYDRHPPHRLPSTKNPGLPYQGSNPRNEQHDHLDSQYWSYY